MTRLRQEISTVMGDEITPDRSHVQKLRWLKCVINETCRLYPQLPVNVRIAAKDTVIPKGGGPDGQSPVMIPKRHGIAWSTYHMHRREALYGPDAESYRPERWETGELDNIGWGFMPFHGGPRLCLGKDFALMEASCVIVKILQTFPNLRLPDNHPVEPTGQETQTLGILITSAEGCLYRGYKNRNARFDPLDANPPAYLATNEEEITRENEKKKIRKEVALLKRYFKDVQARTQDLRAKEDLKRQETYLDEAYTTRLPEEEQEAEWDPIEDVIEDERGNYIDLIKHILSLMEFVDDSQATNGSNQSFNNGIRAIEAHDSKTQMRKRPSEGVKLEYASGFHVAGTVDNPAQTHDKTAPVPDDEIDQLLVDMAEIKHLLFCRLLLSQANVVPAAIRVSNVNEFLDDKEVTDTDLRDLALKLENPGLQEIRGTCADFRRGEEGEEDVYEEPGEEVEVYKVKKIGLGTLDRKRRCVPDSWVPEGEEQVTKTKQARQGTIDQSNSMFENPPDVEFSTIIGFG
ncbi:MAG: hypothetical protein Q9166_003660 [cf. Caloplaca sp. 2 TL-2023]